MPLKSNCIEKNVIIRSFNEEQSDEGEIKGTEYDDSHIKVVENVVANRLSEFGAAAARLESCHSNSDKAISKTSRASHTRLETIQINERPRKNEKFELYSARKILKKEKQFNRLGGIKLNMRLQDLKSLCYKTHLQNRQNLTHIDLRNNKLQKLPDQICDLILLREIKLDYNPIQNLPLRINRLKSLQYLSVSHNNLRKIQIAQNLEFLIINDNKIKNLPNNIGELQKLRSL